MKVATQCALAGGLLIAGIAHACATPVEIEGCQPTPGVQARDCDVILAQASDFGGPDASVPVATGGAAGGGSSPPPGGAGSGSSPPPGGAGSGGGAPPVGGAGSTGVGGAAGSGTAGAGGAGAAGSGSAGTGSAGTGSAGSGSAGTGSAGTGAGGTGSTSNFDVDSCNLQNQAGCEEFACATACPQNMGNYCLDNCNAILTCVSADPSCITEEDPMCGTPFTTPTFMNNQCTTQVNNSSSPNTPGTPANVALALIRCLCSDPRP